MRGLERGIERAIGPVRTIAYVEIEAFVIENLVRQMEQGLLAPAPVWSNLKTFPAEQFHGKIHGITGGYPCQPFSIAGKRLGEEDERHLWPFIRNHVSAIRPVWCFFENVAEHLNVGFDSVYKDLAALDYRVEAGIFSAEECGHPHLRERLFILALDNTSCFRYQPQYPISARRNGLELSSEEELDNSKCQGLERYSRNGDGEERREGQGGSITQRSLFVAKYGQEQLEWEHQRTVEPGLGCTVNGYNFREDLLRLLGNGVVEQVAELAWLTLWGKMQ
jgi:DNA (cytosine-5)-methyltransferase 1